MEFLPIEKYSLDRKTGKHKKDVKRVDKKAAVKEAKAQRKVKTRKSATTRVQSEARAGKSEEIPVPEEEPKESSRSTKTRNVPNNKLFVNMKKKIVNIQEVKDLHPDIVSITLPRKKNSSWCWAVFESKEKAVKALKVLKKREDIIVSQMLSEESKREKREKTLKKVKIKRAMKKTLKDTWM